MARKHRMDAVKSRLDSGEPAELVAEDLRLGGGEVLAPVA